MVALTALEVGWPERVRDLVPVLEDEGFRGYWCTEHYGHGRSASPVVMAAAAGACAPAGRLRVGTAAVLLRLHRTMEVACAVQALAAQYPGRVDVGIASGLPPQPEVAAALGAVDLDGYEERARALRALLCDRGEIGEPAPLTGPAAPTPAMWVCGTTERSAELAASMGCGFAMFAGADDAKGRDLVDRYRDRFVAASADARPEVCVVAHGWCDLDAVRVADFWRDVPFPARFSGPPEVCADQLLDRCERLACDHLGVATIAPTFEDQVSSYRLLASGLRPDLDR